MCGTSKITYFQLESAILASKFTILASKFTTYKQNIEHMKKLKAFTSGFKRNNSRGFCEDWAIFKLWTFQRIERQTGSK